MPSINIFVFVVELCSLLCMLSSIFFNYVDDDDDDDDGDAVVIDAETLVSQIAT